MSALFVVLGVLALSLALRTLPGPIFRKIGAAGVLVTTFLAVYFPTGSVVAGIVAALIWFLLPWIDLLTRIRHLRLPVEKVLENRPPPGAGRFPGLGEYTDEIEAQGFEYVADKGWDWDGNRQFFRVFYRESDRTSAAICFTEQEGVAWACVNLTSRTKDGRVLRTSNLPFGNPMKTAPGMELRRHPAIEHFDDLLAEHEEWLDLIALEADHLVAEDPEGIPDLIEEETKRQVAHNLESGLIARAEDEALFRYSWRGLFYLYFQSVKDMVRLV